MQAGDRADVDAFTVGPHVLDQRHPGFWPQATSVRPGVRRHPDPGADPEQDHNDYDSGSTHAPKVATRRAARMLSCGRAYAISHLPWADHRHPMRADKVGLAAAFGSIVMLFLAQAWWVLRHPPDEAPGVRRRALRRGWRWNLVIVSPLAALSFIAMVVLLVQAVVPSKADAHFTARRGTMEIDVEGSDQPAETAAVFVLEADPGWRIVYHGAQLRSNPGGPPLWTMGQLDPERGHPGAVVSGTPSFETDERPIMRRIIVRVPPTTGSNVLCTSLAPAATEGRGTQEGVPDRLKCVAIPGR